jgi:uncharacterized protein YegL
MAEHGKMESLNTAAREIIPHLRDVAEENPNADVLMRVLSFSTGAHWEVKTPQPIETFSWADLRAGGRRDMGAALSLVAEVLKTQMPLRGLPPVLVLISDGTPTDDFDKGLRELMAQPWARRAVRAAIAIGKDANLDVLERFIGNKELKPLLADNPEALVRIIKFVSTTVENISTDTTDEASHAENINPHSQSEGLSRPINLTEAAESPPRTQGLNDHARQTLCDILTKYGSELYDQPRRCEALLRDLSASHKREISVLIAALEFGVVGELASLPNTSPEIVIARLSDQLEDNLGLTPIAARWAVESWAIAVGLTSSAKLRGGSLQISSKLLAVEDRSFRIAAPTGQRTPVLLRVRNGIEDEPDEPYWYKREAEKIKRYVVSAADRPILLTGHGHFGESYLAKWAINKSAVQLAQKTGTRHDTVIMKIPINLVGQDSERLWVAIDRWVISSWENPKNSPFKKRYKDKLKILGQDAFFSLRELTITETDGAPQGEIHVSGPVGGARFTAGEKGRESERVYVPLKTERLLERLLQSIAFSLPSEPGTKLTRFFKALWTDGIPYRIVLLVDKIDDWDQLKALECLLETGGALKIVVTADRSHYDEWTRNTKNARWINSKFNIIKCAPVLDENISETLTRFFFAIEPNDFAKPIVRDFVDGLNFHCYGSPASLPRRIFDDWAESFDEAGGELLLSDDYKLMTQYRVWAKANQILCREWRWIIGNYMPFEAPDHPTLGEYDIRARRFLYDVLKQIIQIGNTEFSERALLEICRQYERRFNLEMSWKNLAEVSRRLLDSGCRVGMLEPI